MSELKGSKTMPKEGQFVGVWSWDNKPWSYTFKWVEGELFQFNDEEDEFIPIRFDPEEIDNISYLKFF